MKIEIIVFLLVLISAGYAVYTIMSTAYASTQVIEVKQDLMRPCDVCPREYYYE